ncbi:MAG: hemerythrin domain-containing protein [Rhodosalinus sp.]|uniref:hemerythrin domain-containing protein n=1 Tax=Rhodosalinus sp. TaxID=2047741 RepID=UPI00397CB12E
MPSQPSAEPDDPLALGIRDGLPEALTALLEVYPRARWAQDPGFAGLVQFWLDRHGMFRKLSGLLTQEARATEAGGMDPAAFAPRLSRFGGMFLQELHGHHMIEDHHYFPVLTRLESKLERGFGLLDADHHALDPWLARLAERANALIAAAGQGGATADPAGRLAEDLATFAPLLDRHLTDEEDLVVPVLLRHRGAGLT